MLRAWILLLMVCIASTWPDFATAGEKGLVEQETKPLPVQLQKMWEVYQISLPIEQEQRTENLRLVSIKERTDLLQGELASESLIQVYLQLANLYFEEGHFLYYNEILKLKTDTERCINTLGCDITSIKSDYSESKKYLKHSISFYKKVIVYAPTVSYADEALFYMGQALYDIGEVDHAVVTFQELTSTYPKSVYTTDAYLFIGEYWFEKNDYLNAIEAYRYTIAYEEGNYYGFALYKLAWCYYNVYRYDDAIDLINTAINYLKTPKQPDNLVCDTLKGFMDIRAIGCYIANIHQYEYTPNVQVNQFLLDIAQKDRELFNSANASK